MATDFREAKKRLDAAQNLFSSTSTTIEKLRSASGLVRGLSPRMDALLVEYEKHLTSIETFTTGDIISLSAEQLPEDSEEEKERKKLFLFFLKSWNDLKSEVARVRAELERSQQNNQNSNGPAWGKIFHAVKGPLGIITVLAVGIALLQTTSVTISIVNAGCNVIEAKTSIPVSLPGLKLPNGPIAPGESATAVMPPLSFDIDGTKSGTLSFSSFKFSMTIGLSSEIRDITLDGGSLLGRLSHVNLGDKKSHELRLVCRA